MMQLSMVAADYVTRCWASRRFAVRGAVLDAEFILAQSTKSGNGFESMKKIVARPTLLDVQFF